MLLKNISFIFQNVSCATFVSTYNKKVAGIQDTGNYMFLGDDINLKIKHRLISFVKQ